MEVNNMEKEDILVCNGKGHFMLFVDIDDDDIEPIALYHEEQDFIRITLTITNKMLNKKGELKWYY